MSSAVNARLFRDRSILRDIVPRGFQPPDEDVDYVLSFEQPLFDTGLRTLDTTTLGGLLCHVHANERLDIRNKFRLHIEPAYLPVGLTQ